VRDQGSARIAGRVLGWMLLAVGAIATYNLFVPPGIRVGGPLIGLPIFFGPTLLAVGTLILVYGRSPKDLKGDQPLSQRVRTLLGVGVGLLAAPVLLAIAVTATRDELIGFLYSMSVIVLGLPGVACLVSAAILWLSERLKAARTPSG